MENARKLYGDGATAYLKENGFADVFGWKLTDVTNYGQSLKELTKGFKANTEARKKFMSSVDADTVTQKRKEDQEAISNLNQELRTQLSMLNEQYETYKKIYQLTGDQQGAMSLAFGGRVESTTYRDELTRRMKEALEKAGRKENAANVFKMDKNTFEQTTFGENSQTFSELYAAYAENEKRIKQETLSLFEDVVSKNRTLAQQIDDENRAYERQLELIKQIKDPTLRAQAEQGLTQSHNEKIAHIQFEQFKQNSNWVKIFDDLDRVSTETLNDMINAVEEFSKTAGLSVEDVKALQEAISKLRNEAQDRNPFLAMSDAINRMNILNKAEKTHADGDIAGVELGKVLGVDPNSKVTKKQIKDGKRAANADYVGGLNKLQSKFTALSNVLSPVIDLFDKLGMTEVGQVIGAAQGALSGAATGAAAFQALGMAGPWGAVAGAGLSLISSGIDALFGGHDEALEKEIQASKCRQKEMENLTDNLKSVLEHTLGGIYTAKADQETIDKMNEYSSKYEARQRAREAIKNGKSTIWNLIAANRDSYISDRTYKQIQEAQQSRSYYDAQKASLMIQQDELRKQIESEKDKKETDWDAVQSMEQQIKELELEIRYFAEEMAKDLYGIDYKSWASGLADALVTAWAAGEDAADAYRKKVSEILRDVGVKIITQKYLEPLLQKNMDEFIKYFEANDGRVDERGLEILAKMYDDADKAAAVTSAYLDGLEQIANQHGETIKDNDSSSASNSIKGITESTADLLASYLNAIRADVAANRAMIASYYPQFLNGINQNNVIANAQLAELRSIVTNTRRNADIVQDIYNILHGVAPDGQSIKVK